MRVTGKPTRVKKRQRRVNRQRQAHLRGQAFIAELQGKRRVKARPVKAQPVLNKDQREAAQSRRLESLKRVRAVRGATKVFRRMTVPKGGK